MGADQQLSVTKILICFSVVVSLGSIIIGLFLISHHTALKYASIGVVVRLMFLDTGHPEGYLTF